MAKQFGWQDIKTLPFLVCIPWKISMELKNGGLVQEISMSKWRIYSDFLVQIWGGVVISNFNL